MTEVFIYFFIGALVSAAFFIFTYRSEQQLTGRDLLVGVLLLVVWWVAIFALIAAGLQEIFSKDRIILRKKQK